MGGSFLFSASKGGLIWRFVRSRFSTENEYLTDR